jgi:hypothetical protein
MATSQQGKANVRQLYDAARPVPMLRREDPEPGKPRDGVLPGQWTPGPLGLPPGCPVTPLGCVGGANYFLDPIGQLAIYAKPYGQADTLDLFRGRHWFLYWAYPNKWKSRPDPSGSGEDKLFPDSWKNERVREDLIAAATVLGAWSPSEKLRGRGCWLSDDGELIVHLGNRMLRAGVEVGHHNVVDGCVYPTRPAIMEPAGKELADLAVNQAARLRDLFATWNWERPHVNPHLLVGWIGVAFLGAALPWRANIYITGDAASGKSTLQNVLKGVLGDWLVKSADTTAAGIYQRVKTDSLAVSVDEFEAEGGDNAKLLNVLKLARRAASGDLMLRGGDRHQGVEFQARSALLFSSINAPPLEPQDLSRFALLALGALPKGSRSPDVTPRDLAGLGRVALRRLIDQWPRFDQTLAAFRGAMAEAGMGGRGQDVFGTLLACADLIEHDQWDEARLSFPVDGDMRPWSELLEVSAMVEFEDQTANWRGCLNYLLSVPIEAWRNSSRHTVGQFLAALWAGDDPDVYDDAARIKGILAVAGLGYRRGHMIPGTSNYDDWLVIPNQSPILHALFRGEKWAGSPGAGVWKGALRQSPRETVHRVGNETVAGVKRRCTLIRLAALYGDDGMMQ